MTQGLAVAHETGGDALERARVARARARPITLCARHKHVEKPSRRVALLLFSWDVFQLLVTLISCAEYAAGTAYYYDKASKSLEPPAFFAIADTVFPLLFAADFCLKLYSARNRVYFLLSPIALVDYVVIIPGLFVAFRPDLTSMLVMRLLRVLRMLRILRLFAAFRLATSTVLQALLKPILLLVTLIFVTAGILQLLEMDLALEQGVSPASPPLTFLDTLYFLVVTLSTVGYGDITLSTPGAKAVVVLFFSIIIVMLPTLLADFSALYYARSQFRGRYAVSPAEGKHVLILNAAGEGHEAIIAELLHELHHEINWERLNRFAGSVALKHLSNAVAGNLRTEQSTIKVPAAADACSAETRLTLVMGAGEPPESLQRILRHASYDGRARYVRGSCASRVDLEHVDIASAAAVFVVSDFFAGTNGGAGSDALTALTLLTLRTCAIHVPVFVLGHSRLALSVLAPPDMIPAAPIAGPIPGGVVAFAGDELNMAFLTASARVPGASTLLINFLRAPLLSPVELQLLKPAMVEQESEYAHGAVSRVMLIGNPPSLDAFDFTRVANALYCASQGSVIALGIQEEWVLRGSREANVRLARLARVRGTIPSILPTSEELRIDALLASDSPLVPGEALLNPGPHYIMRSGQGIYVLCNNEAFAAEGLPFVPSDLTIALERQLGNTSGASSPKGHRHRAITRSVGNEYGFPAENVTPSTNLLSTFAISTDPSVAGSSASSARSRTASDAHPMPQLPPPRSRAGSETILLPPLALGGVPTVMETMTVIETLAALRITSVPKDLPLVSGYTIVSCAMADAPRIVRSLRMHTYRSVGSDGRSGGSSRRHTGARLIILYVARGDDGANLTPAGASLLEAAGDVRIVMNHEGSISAGLIRAGIEKASVLLLTGGADAACEAATAHMGLAAQRVKASKSHAGGGGAKFGGGGTTAVAMAAAAAVANSSSSGAEDVGSGIVFSYYEIQQKLKTSNITTLPDFHIVVDLPAMSDIALLFSSGFHGSRRFVAQHALDQNGAGGRMPHAAVGSAERLVGDVLAHVALPSGIAGLAVLGGSSDSSAKTPPKVATSGSSSSDASMIPDVDGTSVAKTPQRRSAASFLQELQALDHSRATWLSFEPLYVSGVAVPRDALPAVLVTAFAEPAVCALLGAFLYPWAAVGHAPNPHPPFQRRRVAAQASWSALALDMSRVLRVRKGGVTSHHPQSRPHGGGGVKPVLHGAKPPIPPLHPSNAIADGVVVAAGVETDRTASFPPCDKWGGSTLSLRPLPRKYIGKTFFELVRGMLLGEGAVVMGVYRTRLRGAPASPSSAQRHVEDSGDDVAPPIDAVITAPHQSLVLREKDALYVLERARSPMCL